MAKVIVGANVPFFAFYGGINDPGVPKSVQNEQIEKVFLKYNLKVARLFVRHEAVDKYVDRVNEAVGLLEDNGISAILCLIDVFSNKGLILPEDKVNYYPAPGKLDRKFYTDKAYKGAYFDLINKIVPPITRDHQNVLMWEIGNELTTWTKGVEPTPTQVEDFFTFVSDTKKEILKASKNKARIGTGLVASHHIVPASVGNRKALVKKLYDMFDFISFHYYPADDDHPPTDFATERSYIDFDLGIIEKPFYIGEFGADFTPKRKGYYEKFLPEVTGGFVSGNTKLITSYFMPWDVGVPSSSGFGQLGFNKDTQPDHLEIFDMLKATSEQEAAHEPVHLRTSIDRLKHISDETIPDWTVVKPNQNLGKKIWKVRNNGTTNWTENYLLVHDEGNQMGAPDSVLLPPLAPGEEGIITVEPIIAPATEGNYVVSWVPRSATGKSFSSNLTIVIKVSSVGDRNVARSNTVQAIVQELAPYGIILVPDNWTNAEAQRLINAIVPVAQRLFDFASQNYTTAVLQTPQQVFRKFFVPRGLQYIKRNTDPDKDGAYAWNDGSITFYSKVFFQQPQMVKRQSPYSQFRVTHTTEFLVLHELCHNVNISDQYSDASKEIARRLSVLFPDRSRFDIATDATIASAGFKHGARSRNNLAEFSTDALANWGQESFTNDQDGFGVLRREQMNGIVSTELQSIYGPIEH